jgi:type IV pilus assembly protein PilA
LAKNGRPGRPTRRRRGFTLIELMIVVAIVGILSAIAIPSFLRFQLRAKSSEGKLNLGAIHSAQIAYRAVFDTFVPCAASPTAAPGPRVPYVIAKAGEGFDVIGWEPEGAVYFQYTVATDAVPRSTAFTASAQANIDLDADPQSWAIVRPIPDTAAGVAGAGPCAATGVWDPIAGKATVLDQVGPCDATSAQSVF